LDIETAIDGKREYLMRTFSRTKRKDYENYVVTAIWHKLGRSDIQPVTQQYIKRSDGRYALVDLYFPQLNIGIECDEAYHLDAQEADKQRTLTMEEVLSAYDETADFQLIRIRAYESIEGIERQIDDAVTAIRDKIRFISRHNFLAWQFNDTPHETALVNKQIRVTDRLDFRTIVDLCRCFGKDYKGIQRSYFNLGNGYQLWCPKLAVRGVDGKLQSVSRGWVNTLSEDWNHIFQANDDPTVLRDLEKPGETRPRVTFAQSTDALGRTAYRFIGVYELDNTHPHSSWQVEVHKRTAEYIDLTPWLGKSEQNT